MAKSAQWTVTLIRAPVSCHYGEGFSPRRFHYKWEAEELVRKIKHSGGEAKLEREKR